jgi:hypothetical protein
MDVDKREVAVGESLTLTVEMKQVSTSGNVVSGEPQLPTSELFQIQGTNTSSLVTIVNQQTVLTNSTHYSLVAVKAGTEALGPASVIFQDPSGKRQEIKSNVINVTVTEKKPFSLFGGSKPASNTAPDQSPAVSPTGDELRGLKPLLPDPLVWLFRIFLVILLIALIGGFLAWRKWGPKKKQTKSVQPLDQEGGLREAWKKLADEDLTAEAFCRSLSSIIRECLEYHFEFPAVDCTTEEIFRELKNHELTPKQQEAVEKCLKSCDRVLYADGNLTGRDTLRSLASSLLPKIQQ